MISNRLEYSSLVFAIIVLLWQDVLYFFYELEIKTLGLVLEFEMSFQQQKLTLHLCCYTVTSKVSGTYRWGLRFLNNFYQRLFSKNLFWPAEDGFWPLTAYITSEVKISYAHVKTPGMLNKFPENKIFVGCNGLAVMLVSSASTPIKNIDKYLYQYQ